MPKKEVAKKENRLWEKSPIIGDNGENFDGPEDKKKFVAKTLTNIMRLYNIPLVKSDEEAQERIVAYFVDCAETGRRPLWEELCLALGTTRKTVWRWEHETYGPGHGVVRAETISRARECLAAYDAAAAVEGKCNPVLYFFRSKNFYDMKDQQDVIITPNTPLGSETDAEKLENKYAESVIDTEGTDVEE